MLRTAASTENGGCRFQTPNPLDSESDTDTGSDLDLESALALAYFLAEIKPCLSASCCVIGLDLQSQVLSSFPTPGFSSMPLLLQTVVCNGRALSRQLKIKYFDQSQCFFKFPK